MAQSREDRSWTRRRRGQEAASVRMKSVAGEGPRESMALGRGKDAEHSLRNRGSSARRCGRHGVGGRRQA